jgi:hypothetical protein
MNRVYEDPYRNSYSKDPPGGSKKAQPFDERFNEKAATADIRSFGSGKSSHHEEMMRIMDPMAFREYENLKKAGTEGRNPMASTQFMMSWIEDKNAKDPGMERKFSKQNEAIKSLESRFGNVGISIEGVSARKGKDGVKDEFSVTLTKDELRTLTYGTDEEKEAIYKQIDDAMKTIKEAEKSLSDEDAEKVKIGVDTNGKDGKFDIFGIGEDGKKTDGLFNESIFKEIFEKIFGTDEEKKEAREAVLEANM